MPLTGFLSRQSKNKSRKINEKKKQNKTLSLHTLSDRSVNENAFDFIELSYRFSTLTGSHWDMFSIDSLIFP